MTSVQHAGLLHNLIPEIYPIIAEHLPLHATPSTLLALALVNHHISEIVLPLVYSRLILKNEDDAIRVIQKLLTDSMLGRLVHELHIMSDLSLATRNGENPFDVVRGVQQVIEKGLLPFMHTLGMDLGCSWHYDDEFVSLTGFGHLTCEFWAAITGNCPRFKALVLNGFGDDPDEPWVEKSGTLEVPGLTCLSLHFRSFNMNEDGRCEKLLKHISTLSSSLHTLGLTSTTNEWTDAGPILSLRFPRLQSLRLSSFDAMTTEDPMAFWESHPGLQHIDLVKNDASISWFSREFSTDFLPNLRHFRARLNDVRSLAPILPQLLSLSIFGSMNAQVPHLLRVVVPDGLPNLKSLDIGQESVSRKDHVVNVEGALWYEDVEGVFHEVPWKKKNRLHNGEIFSNYVRSISRGAPNLEELAFSVSEKDKIERLVGIAEEFKGFKHLKRIYFTHRNMMFSEIDEDAKNILLSQAKRFAAAVPSLVSFTDTNVSSPPYATVHIERDENGGVAGASLGKGYGLLIGHDDEAFPNLPGKYY